MIVIGADAHKSTQTIVAVDGATGRELGQLEFSSRPGGALEAMLGAADLEPGRERVWAIEDVRHVSGRLERELIRHGQAVVRVAETDGRGPAGGPAARQERPDRRCGGRVGGDPRRHRDAAGRPA